MKHRIWTFLGALAASVLLLAASPMARAEDEAPDAFVKRISTDVLETIKADKSMRSGDLGKVIALVDTRIMPHVDFQRMTVD